MRIRNKSIFAIAGLMLVAMVVFLVLYFDGNADEPSVGDDVVYGPVSEVFDNTFDDNFIADMPAYIGGYKLTSITTPRTLACQKETVFTFLAHQETVEEYLAAPMDHDALRAEIIRLVGREIEFSMGFGSGSTKTQEERAEFLLSLNRERVELGCEFFRWGRLGPRRGDE